jgi:Ca2+-binding RTX toxin-like protein
VGVNLGSTDIVPSKAVAGILLPLADNGGGTHTHALAIGSPALNASPDDAGCRPIDQRGNPRPRGAACDIGAFEGSAVLCGGRVTTMVGTVNADDLTGTPGADVISGLNGNDVITGLDGNDVICGGTGADRAYGGIGNDVIFGEAGNDRLLGQGGVDKLNGGPDQDYCDGGSQAGAGDTATACETVIGVP